MLILSDARNREAWFARCCLWSESAFVARSKAKLKYAAEQATRGVTVL
jgi:hypothetical protein